MHAKRKASSLMNTTGNHHQFRTLATLFDALMPNLLSGEFSMAVVKL